MTLADFGTIAEIVSAIAVLVTLVYLSIQTRHANKLARMQTRQRIAEAAGHELGFVIEDPAIIALLSKPAPLEHAEAMRLYHYLILVLRQREWEWYQASNGAIPAADAEQVKRDCLDVAGFWLDYRRARKWWEAVGHMGFNPQFVAELNALLDGRPIVRHDMFFMEVETALAEEDKQHAGGGKQARPRAKK